MNQQPQNQNYAELIQSIKKKKKITIIVTIIVAIAIGIFCAPSTMTHTVNGVTQTVVREGLPAGVVFLWLLIVCIVEILVLVRILYPVTAAMDLECDPEKQLILVRHLYKEKTAISFFAQDYLYLGNYQEAIRYADQMIHFKRKNFVLTGLFQKARCAFLMGDTALLKECTEHYTQTLAAATRLSKKNRSIYETCLTVLRMLCALADHNHEEILALKKDFKIWHTAKATKGFVEYVKALISRELGDEEDAEFRFRLVKDQYPKLVLARLAEQHLTANEDVPTSEEADSPKDFEEPSEEEPDREPAPEITFDASDFISPIGSLQKPSGALRAVSIFLFVLSILSIWIALFCVAVASAITKSFGNEMMWLFFPVAFLPISSIIFGFRMKKKGFKYKKNVIVGFIMAILLCLYGSFFFFPDTYSHDDAPILHVEESIGIDIPPHTQINTQDFTLGTQSGGRGYIFSTSEIYFDEADVDAFETALATDERWISSIPTELIGIASDAYDVSSADYSLLYNTQTEELNKLPEKAGTYRMINILYYCESDVMVIVEYEIDYVK